MCSEVASLKLSGPRKSQLGGGAIKTSSEYPKLKSCINLTRILREGQPQIPKVAHAPTFLKPKWFWGHLSHNWRYLHFISSCFTQNFPNAPVFFRATNNFLEASQLEYRLEDEQGWLCTRVFPMLLRQHFIILYFTDRLWSPGILPIFVSLHPVATTNYLLNEWAFVVFLKIL